MIRRLFAAALLLATVASTDPVADTRQIMAGTVTTASTKKAYLSGSRDSTAAFQGALSAYKAVRAAEQPVPTPVPVPVPAPVLPIVDGGMVRAKATCATALVNPTPVIPSTVGVTAGQTYRVLGKAEWPVGSGNVVWALGYGPWVAASCLEAVAP